VAAADAMVIIEGESGTGKELVAKAIHQQSPRSKGPFIPVNCSALAETLLESELFGHVKGAFTGAVNSKVGRFELAKGGTLFLDEIGEIKPEIQIKLLRVLEEKVFERVGGTRPIPMDTRIITATNKTLLQEVHEGRFREDLFYRLRTVPLYLPPLRERKSDIPLLVNHFVSKFNQKYGKQVRGIDPKVLKLFNQYSWPGNIRELERAIEYAFVFVKGPIITSSHLPELRETADPKNHREPDRAAVGYLWEDEKIAIEDVLRKTQGRRDEAASILGISRTSLWRKMKTHGII
jgi:transcriptional regulator with PAS, ATPase and Fis domain